MQRFFRYSLRSLMLVITLSAIYFGWKAYQERLRQREQRRKVASQVAESHIIRTHWQALESDPAFRSVISQLSDEFTSDTSYESRVLLPDGTFKDGTSGDKFEQQLMQDIMGSNPSERVDAAGMVERRSYGFGFDRYYQVIRAEESCVVCHRNINNDLDLEVGDLLAVVRVKLED